MYRLVCDFVVGVYYVLDIELLWVFSLLFVFFFCFFFVLGGFFFFFFFFFSSRRRHTRFSRDGVQTCALPIYLWLSQGVLEKVGWKAWMVPPLRSEAERRRLLSAACSGASDVVASDHAPHTVGEKERQPRSEERRVGKECRYRWWTDHEKREWK